MPEETQLDRIETGITKIHEDHGARLKALEDKANEIEKKQTSIGWLKMWCATLTAGLAKIIFIK